MIRFSSQIVTKQLLRFFETFFLFLKSHLRIECKLLLFTIFLGLKCCSTPRKRCYEKSFFKVPLGDSVFVHFFAIFHTFFKIPIFLETFFSFPKLWCVFVCSKTVILGDFEARNQHFLGSLISGEISDWWGGGACIFPFG